VCEPAFWAGYDRGSAEGFRDYFRQLTEYEPARAAKFLLPHYCWIGLNPKEAEDLALARDVLSIIPEFLKKPTVLGVGEIGLNRNTRNELRVLEDHVEMAVQHDQLMLVHTPHLEDKLKGTRLIGDLLRAHPKVNPERVIDHVEERDRACPRHGLWAGITYPTRSRRRRGRATCSKCPGSACGSTRPVIGVGDPLSVPKAVLELRRRGHTAAFVDKSCIRTLFPLSVSSSSPGPQDLRSCWPDSRDGECPHSLNLPIATLISALGHARVDLLGLAHGRSPQWGPGTTITMKGRGG
jgi:predicted metal-dependent TIM-barrel fold hydrolase